MDCDGTSEQQVNHLQTPFDFDARSLALTSLQLAERTVFIAKTLPLFAGLYVWMFDTPAGFGVTIMTSWGETSHATIEFNDCGSTAWKIAICGDSTSSGEMDRGDDDIIAALARIQAELVTAPPSGDGK